MDYQTILHFNLKDKTNEIQIWKNKNWILEPSKSCF